MLNKRQHRHDRDVRTTFGFDSVSAALDYHHHRYGFLIRRAQQVMASLFAQERRFEGPGLSLSQLELLFAVHAEPGMRQSQISARLGMGAANTALMLGQLDRVGLIERLRGSDSRTKEVALTSAAAPARAAGLACAGRAAERFVAPIGGTKARALDAVLVEIADGRAAALALRSDPDRAPDGFLPVELRMDFRLGRCAGAYVDKVVPALGRISLYQYAALFLIAVLPVSDQATVARALGIERPSANLILTALLGRQLIDRAADPQDGRRQLLWATAEGADLIRRLKPIVEQADERLVAGLTPARRAIFVDHLYRILHAHHALVVRR